MFFLESLIVWFSSPAGRASGAGSGELSVLPAAHRLTVTSLGWLIWVKTHISTDREEE